MRVSADKGNGTMTTQAERHERLAESVATFGDCTLFEASAILALIAYRLAEVTPEMDQAWLESDDLDSSATWRAMLAASALVNGEKP